MKKETNVRRRYIVKNVITGNYVTSIIKYGDFGFKEISPTETAIKTNAVLFSDSSDCKDFVKKLNGLFNNIYKIDTVDYGTPESSAIEVTHDRPKGLKIVMDF